MSTRLTTTDFIKCARQVHGDKYDYSHTVYTGRHSKLSVVCPIHGCFEQTAGSHLIGRGCPACGKITKADKRRFTVCDFIKNARTVHGDKYDYSKSVYVNSRTRLIITCREHGDFEQSPDMHYNLKQGCPTCGIIRRSQTQNKGLSKFITEANSVHGGKYDYSKTDYVNARHKLVITCPEHGDFEQVAANHVNLMQGCPKCANRTRPESLRYSLEKFIELANLKHSGKYDYSKSIYIDSQTPLTVTCQEHGDFEQRPYSHLAGFGCAKCAGWGSSKGEQAIFDYIKSVHPDAIQSDRNVIAPFELDVVVPSLKLAVEFNGIYWHSEKYRDDTYHINKRKMTEQAGYRLISIREDLWNERRPQIEAIINNALGVNTRRVYARKCTIVAADKDTAATFFDANHVQGNRAASQYWSLVHNGETVAVMSATHWRKKDEWELVRYATSCNVVGGLSKLWKHIVKVNNITRAYSYVDRDLFTGESYGHAGFKYDSTTVGFRIVTGETTESRQKWNNAPDGLTQNEWYEREGVCRIYDAGQDKLIFG